MRVTLRPLTRGDLPALFEDQRDADAARRAVVSMRDRPAFDAHWEKQLADPTVLPRAVEADGALAGFIGAWNRDGERQVGYWLGRAHWGRGIASEALRAMLALELQRPLYAHVARGNPASVKVLEKCGFTLRRVARAHETLNIAGQLEPVDFIELSYRLDR